MDYVVREHTVLLDKAVFNKIRIKSIRNIEALQDREIVTIKQKSKANYITESGQEFSSLQIKGDGVIDKMVAGSKILGNNRIDYCNLSVTIRREDGTNLNCYSVAEYKEHLETVRQHLMDEYGIEASFDNVSLKELEINKTFRLEHDFREYHRVLEVIMWNLPSIFTQSAEFRQRLKTDESFNTGTYYASTSKSKRSDHYLLFKVYDKTRSVEQVIMLTDSYMRVELKLVGADKIERDLGTKLFMELTDERVNDYFSEKMQKLIIQPYVVWKAQRDKFVLEVMKTQLRGNQHHWIVDTLRTLTDKSIKENCPVLLDVGELMPLIDQVITGDRKKRYKIKKAFRRQAEKYETVLCNGDDLKMDEIVRSVTS